MSEQALVEELELLLAFDNLALASTGATVESNITAASATTAVSNLATEALDQAFRTSSLAAFGAANPGVFPRVDITLGEPEAVSWGGLHRHNVLVPWRMLLYKASPGSGAQPVFTSPWTDPVIRANPGDFTWRDMPWTLGPNQKRLDALATSFRLESFITTDELYYSVRVVRFEFDTTDGDSNGGLDYLQASVGFPTRVFQPRINMLLGWGIGANDRSIWRRVESGAVTGRKRSIGRVFPFTLGYLDRDEAFERILQDLVLEKGRLGRVFAWPEPHHRRYFYGQAFVGTLTEIPRAEMRQLEWPAATGFIIEETN